MPVTPLNTHTAVSNAHTAQQALPDTGVCAGAAAAAPSPGAVPKPHALGAEGAVPRSAGCCARLPCGMGLGHREPPLLTAAAHPVGRPHCRSATSYLGTRQLVRLKRGYSALAGDIS